MDQCPACGAVQSVPITMRTYVGIFGPSGVCFELGVCNDACKAVLLSPLTIPSEETLTGWVRMCRGVQTNILPLAHTNRAVIAAYSVPVEKPAPLQGVQAMVYAMQALHNKRAQDAKDIGIKSAKTRKAVENMANAIARGSLDAYLKSLIEVVFDRAENAAIAGDDTLVTQVVDIFATWSKDRGIEW